MYYLWNRTGASPILYTIKPRAAEAIYISGVSHKPPETTAPVQEHFEALLINIILSLVLLSSYTCTSSLCIIHFSQQL